MKTTSRPTAATVFPWRAENQLQLWVDGVQFFPALLAALHHAQHAIEIELYLLEEGTCAEIMVAALCRAARRGVQVRCVFDALGGRRLGARLCAKLQAAGVQVRWYNPLGWRHGVGNFYRNHRKVLLIDRTALWMGGMGLTDAFWHPQRGSAWHELMVCVRGPLVADAVCLFEQQWRTEAPPRAWPLRWPVRACVVPPPPSATGWARLSYTDANHREILHSLLCAIERAQRRLWLATPYFLPSWRLRRALARAVRRGVEVRLLLCGTLTDHPPVRHAGQRYYLRLLKAGVRIFEYQPRFSHLKAVIADDWLSIGSCNFDRWTLRYDLEANLESVDATLRAALEANFCADFQASQEITLAAWRARSWRQRVKQWWYGWLDQLLIDRLDRWR